MPAQVHEVNENGIQYPWLSTQFPPNVRSWLASKYVEPEYRRQNNMFWNEMGQELVFPIHDENGKMVFTNARYFGKEAGHPRYRNQGNNTDHALILGDLEANVVFIVEDYISALRIGTAKSLGIYNPELRFAAYPMFGSNPNHDHMLELSQKFLGCIFFMDPDKHKEAQEFSLKYSQYFQGSGWIHSKKDPKDYTPPDLNLILTSHVQQMEHRLFENPLYKGGEVSKAEEVKKNINLVDDYYDQDWR